MKKIRRNALNIQDYIHYWESNHGEQRAGHFNVELYLAILTIKNNQ